MVNGKVTYSLEWSSVWRINWHIAYCASCYINCHFPRIDVHKSCKYDVFLYQHYRWYCSAYLTVYSGSNIMFKTVVTKHWNVDLSSCRKGGRILLQCFGDELIRSDQDSVTSSITSYHDPIEFRNIDSLRCALKLVCVYWNLSLCHRYK